MNLILLILLILLLGGGGTFYAGPGVGGLFGVLLIAVLVLAVMGRL